MTDPQDNRFEIFDRRLVRTRRNRAAADFSSFDFLLRRVTEQTCERMLEINRNFKTVLDLGCHNGLFARSLFGQEEFETLGSTIETLLQTDLAASMVSAAPACESGHKLHRLVCDEERLPFSAAGFDLVVSHLGLHAVNDLPGALIQIRQALKPDGLFIGAFFGGQTLHELKASLMQAETEIEGGVSPRIAPFADIRDIGALLQRAGFALPVIDLDRVTVSYDNLIKLMADLRGMGQSNSLIQRRKKPLRRSLLTRASEIYLSEFGQEDGRLPATFEIIFATGWAPHSSQQQALRPGSAKVSLADALAKSSPVKDQ